MGPAGGHRADYAWAGAGLVVVAAVGLGLSATHSSSSDNSAPNVADQALPAPGQSAGGTRGAAPARKVHPTTRLGDLTSFATIVTDVKGKVAKNDLAGGKTRIKDLEVAWDDAEAGLKPRDAGKWHQLDGEIDDALTALRAGSPSQSDCSSALAALSATLNKDDGI
jgi:hypothetical protein